MIQLVLVAVLFAVFSTLSWSTILSVVSIFVVTYLFNLYQQQSSILYQRRTPQQPVESSQFPHFFQSPSDYSLQYQELLIKTSDNHLLSCYYVPAHKLGPDGKYTPIMSSKIAKDLYNTLRIEGSMDTAALGQRDETSDFSDDSDSDAFNYSGDSEASDHSDSDSEDVIKFITPSAANVKDLPPSLKKTNRKKSQIKDINIIDKLFSSPLLSHIVSDAATYDILDLITNTDRHVEADIATLLYFHGNAGSINHRLPNLYHMTCTLGCNVFMVDYRGYGRSEDVQPTEEGLILDAVAAYQYMHHRLDINRNFLYVMGSSLGGAVSIALCAALERTIQRTMNCDNENDNTDLFTKDRSKQKMISYDYSETCRDFIDIVSPMLVNVQPPCGLIVENTFTSISDFVDRLFPFVSPCKSVMLKLKWFSSTRIKSIKTTPILFLHSERDEVIPKGMNDILFKNAGSSDKIMHIVQSANHNNAWLVGGVPYVQQICEFLQRTAKKSFHYKTHVLPGLPSTHDGFPLYRQPHDHIERALHAVREILLSLTGGAAF